jgi:hypothetical protein
VDASATISNSKIAVNSYVYRQEATEKIKINPGPRGVGGGQAKICGLKIKYMQCKKSTNPPKTLKYGQIMYIFVT